MNENDRINTTCSFFILSLIFIMFLSFSYDFKYPTLELMRIASAHELVSCSHSNMAL